MYKRFSELWVTCMLTVGFLYVLSNHVGSMPPLGTLLDPIDGLYRTARMTGHPATMTLGTSLMDKEVTVIRDERGVPHIFAQSDQDAVRALGYVIAQDRLFQLDFIPRVASGRLASALGTGAVDTDRFLRETGMEWGAQKNYQRLQREGGIELETAQSFSDGVNAYLEGLSKEDLPIEFRLLGYTPDPYGPLQSLRLLQYMTYDLTYRTDAADYGRLRNRFEEAEYLRLYPLFSQLYVPIIPETGGVPPPNRQIYSSRSNPNNESRSVLSQHALDKQKLAGTVAEGYVPGKGSNNWGVSGWRSTTGAPILAGDMHLSLSLPAIWYEVHLVTPTMNTYGVTIPGAPLPVEAFTDHIAWAYTNTGSDQIDHLALELDESKARYLFNDAWRDLEIVIDTIEVNRGSPAIDTLYYSHWGPVLMGSDGAVALRWVAHEESRTLRALWGMNHARNYDEFQEALRFWDSPMQNILYADVDGNLAIRSTGFLPMRKEGHGMGLLDGSTDAYAWIGRVPFEHLPHSVNPEQGYLASSNQQPADSSYAYYMGHDWREGYRSLRINQLLRGKEVHTVDDFKAYQSDVHAVQHDLLVPLLERITDLSPRADNLRSMLLEWNGETSVDRPEPLVLDVLLENLQRLAWDEPEFQAQYYLSDAPPDEAPTVDPGPVRKPNDARLLRLLSEIPELKWWDVLQTDYSEIAEDLIRMSLEATVVMLDQEYGWDVDHWRWGTFHKIVFRHLTQSWALRPLWRGPYEYPGFRATLSPAGSRMTTFSASWRMVIDMSSSPPTGYGVYPGGQSGNPFSPQYDAHFKTYLDFDYYKLLTPESPEGLQTGRQQSRIVFLSKENQ